MMTGEKMTVICNIQALENAIGCNDYSFDMLAERSIDCLQTIQDDLIKDYNYLIA